jgi:hypothetical protein
VALAPAADFFVLAALLMARHVCKYKSAARCILKHAAAAAVVCTRWRNNCARELRARPNSAHAPFNLCRGIKIYTRASTTSRTQKKGRRHMQIASPSRRSPARTHLCTAWERSHSAKKVIIPDPGLCVCVCVFLLFFSISLCECARGARCAAALFIWDQSDWLE